MRKLRIFTLLLGFSFVIFAGEEPDPDPSKLIKVKKTPSKVYDTYMVMRSGKLQTAYKNKLFQVYNKQGQLVTENYHFTGSPNTGQLISTKEYTYDENGNRKDMKFTSKGELKYTLVYTFDKDNLLIKQQAFISGKADKPLILKYEKEKSGLVMGRSVLLDGKKVINRKSYAYSPKGFKVKQYEYDEKNRLKSVVQFDINGNPIKETKYFFMFEKPSSNIFEYKYDKFGNLIETAVYDAKGNISTKNIYKNKY